LHSGSVAQSVEQRPFKALVPGSSPGRPTLLKKGIRADADVTHRHGFPGGALFGGCRHERFTVPRRKSGACRRISAGCSEELLLWASDYLEVDTTSHAAVDSGFPSKFKGYASNGSRICE